MISKLLNRRRFLKYAGATAVAGAIATSGATYYLGEKPKLPETVTATSTTASETTTPTVTERYTASESRTVRSTTQTSAVQTGPIIVWESNFKDYTLDGFRAATLDASVGCARVPNQPSDVFARIADDTSAPSGYNTALELIANVNKRNGIFVNGITARSVDFVDDCKWYGYGFFKKSGQIQNVGVNLHLVQDYVARSALFAWILNRYDDLYQWVVLNVPPYSESFDQQKPARMVKLIDDEKWHYFEIEASFTSNPKKRTITRLRIDDAEQQVSFDMPRFHQAWKSSFDLYLETNNFWTNCDPNISTHGVTHWSKVGLVREPLTQE